MNEHGADAMKKNSQQAIARVDKSASAASVKPPRPGVRDSNECMAWHRHGAEVTGTRSKRQESRWLQWTLVHSDGRGPPGSSLNGKLECRIMAEKRKQNSGKSLPWPSFLTLFPEMMPMH